MTDVWMTHPALTPGHDVKILRGGVGAKLSSGWQVREDQSDPAPVDEPADPRLARPDGAAPVDVPVDPRPARPTTPRPSAPQTPASSGFVTPSPLPRKES